MAESVSFGILSWLAVIFLAKDNFVQPLSTSDKNKAITFSERIVSMQETFERNLDGANIKPEIGTPAQGFLINGYPTTEALNYDMSSTILYQASQNLLNNIGCWMVDMYSSKCAISKFNLTGTKLADECEALELVTCSVNNRLAKYRMFNGSCNNPVRSSWGQSLTGYKRLLPPRYSDGIEQPPRPPGYNKLYPSPRLISLKIADSNEVPNKHKTIAFAAWSQFVYHDMVFTPVKKKLFTKQGIRCCDSDGYELIPRYHHPSCFPISMSGGDPFLGKYIYCMEYTRSATTYRSNCTFGSVEQMNQATHFLDGSHIYGSNDFYAAALREKTGALLKTSNLDGEELLPMANNRKEMCLRAKTCFDAADVRVNQNPWLSTLHTIWVREHNRVARSLAQLNPEWNSDKLYHEARRIVVAELQHITYRHWIPALTGKKFNTDNTSYNPNLDPTVTNSFATAAFQFFNSLIDQNILIEDEHNNISISRLRDNYFKGDLLASKGALGKLAKGMVSQKCQKMDLNYVPDVQHHWLGGLDVLALDIQRGRDHGLPTYIEYAKLCGNRLPKSFAHLSYLMTKEVVDKLSSIYDHVSDIDLVVGLMAETPLPNSQIGPTATCLIMEQLTRTLSGDRYFYTHRDQAGSFTERQLAEIKKVTLARLMCDNADLKQVQKDVFRPVDDSNPRVSCEEIKKINLAAWS